MLRRLISKLGWFKMEINKKNEIDVTENNPIIEKNKVPQSEMKSGLQEKKNLKAEGTKVENVKEVVRGKHKVLPCYDNRELSWLKFNERVLDEASDEDVPLCERLTFVSIFSTNLDEFYRVRVGSIYDQMIISDKKRENKTYMTSSEQLERIFKRTKELLKKKEHIYNDLMKEVKNYGVQIVNFDKLSKEEKRQKLEDLLNEFGVAKLRKEPSIALSGGERRRVELARALAASPEFILLDEPFTGIDPIAMSKEKNLGVLITDHNPKATLSITDRAYVIFDGKIKISGKSEDVAVDPVAKEFYLGKDFTL